MASAEIIEEISKFYDIKQKVVNYNIIYYIAYCDINIVIGEKNRYNTYYNNDFNRNIEVLRKNIDRIILLIDKLNEMFEFTYISNRQYDYDILEVGSAKIYFQYIDHIYIYHFALHKLYDSVCDVIEYLKQFCPECIKSSDIKIALKD